MLSYQTCQARRLETRSGLSSLLCSSRTAFSTCLECESHSGDTKRTTSCLKMIGGGSDRDLWYTFVLLMA